MKNKLLLAINTSLVLFLPLSLTSCDDSQPTLQTYSISFYDDDTLISEISTSGYEIITLPEAPIKDNYTFKGWYLIPEPQEYTIYFYVDDDIFSTLQTSGNELITLPDAPKKESYEFVGWFFDKDTFNNQLKEDTYLNKSLDQNINVYANYLFKEEPVKEFTVTFDTCGGDKMDSITTSIISSEPIPTREGYTFLGWYFENTYINKVTFPYEVTQNITLYAKWGENLPTSISFVVSAEGVLTEVNGISETNNVVIIPNQVNNIEVKEIKKELFLNNIYIEKLVIPETVTTLGYRMCYGCTNLKEVNLPDNISVIPDYAFEKCTLLEKINIPQSLVQIRNDAFAESGIKEFIAPDSFKEIWGYAFKDCKNLEKVDLNKTTSIGDMSFENCTKLSSIVLPNTLVELGTYVFSGCTLLNNIKMPSNPIEITNTFIYGSGYYNDAKNWENGILYVDNYLITFFKSN